MLSSHFLNTATSRKKHQHTYKTVR